MPPPRHLASIPALWAVLWCQWWDVSPGLAWKCWRALRRSRSPQARTLTQTILLWRDGFDLCHLIDATLSPQQLVECLESACTEGLLSRQETSAVEQLLLAHVDRDGRWRGRATG